MVPNPKVSGFHCTRKMANGLLLLPALWGGGRVAWPIKREKVEEDPGDIIEVLSKHDTWDRQIKRG